MSEKKKLELDGENAKKIYATAPAEVKVILEQTFGKDYFSEKVRDRINNYGDVLKELGLPGSADNFSIQGMDIDELKTIQAFVKRMRISKVYNQGKLPKRGDKRWYIWWAVASGFDFCNANYFRDCADTSSAARLCLLNQEDAEDVAKKFKGVEEVLIGLQ